MTIAWLLRAVAGVLVAGFLQGNRGALIVLLVVALLWLARVVWSLEPPAPRAAESERESLPVGQFPGYDRLYSAVLLSAGSARHVDLTLRPAVQRILAAEIDDLGPEAVRARVGDDVWRLADPNRRASDDSSSGGLDQRAILALLERLETQHMETS